jgi:hypothetical protein
LGGLTIGLLLYIVLTDVILAKRSGQPFFRWPFASASKAHFEKTIIAFALGGIMCPVLVDILGGEIVFSVLYFMMFLFAAGVLLAKEN